MHFAPAVLAPPLVSRVESLPVRVVLPGLYAAEALVFVVLALIVDSFALAAGARARGRSTARSPRRRARSPARRRPPCSPRPGSCARATRCSTSRSRSAPRAARRSPASWSPAPGSRRRCSPTRSRSWRSPALLAVARRLELPEPEEPEAPWTDRLRRGLAYVRERPGAAPPARRPGARVRLLRPGDPDRGRVREGDARRRRRRLRRPARQLGPRHGRRAASPSPPCAGARCAACSPLSTLAIGVAYLATAISPTLAVACAASFVGGLGNGVQWIGLVTAVQELTRAAFQARVLSLLEALASAMPGIGFLLGGAIAAIFEPRLAYAVAGAGVLVGARRSRRSPAPGRLGARARAGRRCRTACSPVQVPLQKQDPRARRSRGP